MALDAPRACEIAICDAFDPPGVRIKFIAVNDAWRLLPYADVLYSCDVKWWRVARPSSAEFTGERWSSHESAPKQNNKKIDAAAEYGLELITGRDEPGFCVDLPRIHYGGNSGFQAVNLAIQFGAERIRLIGFDMQHTNGQAHFFGNHPTELATIPSHGIYIAAFQQAAYLLPDEISIINCTADSALPCFPRGTL